MFNRRWHFEWTDVWELVTVFFYDFRFSGEAFFIFIPDLFWTFSILNILIFSIILSNLIRSLHISRLIIDLTVPVIFFSFFFIYFFYDISLNTTMSLRIDNFYFFFRILFLIFFLFCLISSRNFFFLEKIYLYEFPILLLLSAEGSFLMLMTDNLFTFYLALEIQNLSFYILASLKRYSNFSTEAGLKYFLLGAFSSSILLFGISILYGILGTLDLEDIYMLLSVEILFPFFANLPLDINLLLFIGVFFFISGLLFKFGSVPFHYWVPDVYEGSPTVVTMFFSLMPKIVLTFFFVKLYFFFFSFEVEFFSMLFLICGFLSLFVGIFNAMYQYKIKRFLAYSSITTVGFVLVSFSTMTFDGFFSGLYFIFCYLFSVALFFFLILNIRKYNLKELNELFDLSLLNNNNILSLFICVIFLSFAGIPPLIGFFGKFFIFFSLLNSYHYLILFTLFLLSVISSFYYLRVIRFIYFTKISESNFYSYFNLNYLFFFIFYFNILFIFFFDFFGEFFYFILIDTFL